ncbi:putative glycine dehydrogenase (decarboxylating) subunit 1 [bacterium HR23]|nr:putative glycine dehydrogenase (decarboxylating) subunit 1 [bacterium HR23]
MTTFAHPYLPLTPQQRQEMLQAISVSDPEELFSDIPPAYRNPPLNLPPPLAEMDLRRELEALASENIVPGPYACFLGAGAYRRFIPSAVKALAGRGEFLTSYTPYQPEVSQGTLQATYEFQSMVCLLTGMEVANAGVYDGATALAEAVLMACRVTGRTRIALLDTLNPRYREVVETYTLPQGLTVDTVPASAPSVDGQTACLVVQWPNFFGYLEDLEALAPLAHAHGALLVVSADPLACALFKPPGHYGADIVTGECQGLGVPLSFGGPYVGLFACRERYLRQMPGRVVGRTVDAQGRTGYVLTLQTREQHIRRERATSNICTAEALIATGVAMYLALMGKQGLRKVAELVWHKAHYTARLLGAIPGYRLPFSGVFFQEFVLQCPIAPAETNRRLLQRRIIGGLDISALVPNGMLVCVTEMNTRQEIEAFARALAEVAQQAPLRHKG